MSIVATHDDGTKWRKIYRPVKNTNPVDKMNLEGSTGRRKHNGNPDAAQMVSRLLAECTTALLEDHNRYIRQKTITISWTVAGRTASVVALFFLYKSSVYQHILKQPSVAHVLLDSSIMLALFTFACLFPIIGDFVSQKIGVLTAPISRLFVIRRIEQLEKLIREASQLEEFGIADLGGRLELDFRISDAETAISLVSLTLRPKRDDSNPYMKEAATHGTRQSKAETGLSINTHAIP